MKELMIFAVFCCGLLAFDASAKIMDREEYMPMYERIGGKRADKIMERVDKTGHGIVSLDEFKNQKLTRGERREIRREKKDGIYKTPEEEFRLIDKNGDGMASYEEMREYYTRRARQRYEK